MQISLSNLIQSKWNRQCLFSSFYKTYRCLPIIWVPCNMVNQFNVVIVYRQLSIYIVFWVIHLSPVFLLDFAVFRFLAFYCGWQVSGECALMVTLGLIQYIHESSFIVVLTVYSRILAIVNLNSTILFAFIHFHCIWLFSYKMILKCKNSMSDCSERSWLFSNSFWNG